MVLNTAASANSFVSREPHHGRVVGAADQSSIRAALALRPTKRTRNHPARRSAMPGNLAWDPFPVVLAVARSGPFALTEPVAPMLRPWWQ